VFSLAINIIPVCGITQRLLNCVSLPDSRAANNLPCITGYFINIHTNILINILKV